MQRIRGLGERLDAHRKRQQALHPELFLTDPDILCAFSGRKSQKRTDQINAVLASLRALGLL